MGICSMYSQNLVRFGPSNSGGELTRTKLPPKNWLGKCVESSSPRSSPAPDVYQRL